jgi:hypothetical protein
MGYQSMSLSFCCYNGVQSQILEIIALVPLLYTTNLLSFFQLRTISARLSRCTITRQGAPPLTKPLHHYPYFDGKTVVFVHQTRGNHAIT